MKANLLNHRITNDKALYHDTLEPVFGVCIDKVKFVDTNARKSLISVEYKSQVDLQKAVNFLEECDVDVSIVDDNFHVESTSGGGLSFEGISENFCLYNDHKFNVVVDEILNTIYHLVISPSYITHGYYNVTDKFMLNNLKASGIHLNHWDTSVRRKKRKSLVLPVGKNLGDFKNIANKYGHQCDFAWRESGLWNSAVDSLYNTVKNSVLPKKYGLNYHDLEDSFLEVITDMYILLERTSNLSSKGEAINEKKLAGILGNFNQSVRWKLLSKINNNNKISSSYDISELASNEDSFTHLMGLDHINELGSLITPWIDSLSDFKIDIIKMRFENKSIKHISEKHNKSDSSIKVMSHRLFSDMKNIINVSIPIKDIDRDSLYTVINYYFENRR